MLLIIFPHVYPLLSRLKNKGFVDSEWIESKQGPPRKYFHLTKNGKKYLTELTSSYLEVNSSIQNLINNK